MDTLYVLSRSVDHRYTLPLDAAEAQEAFSQKRAYFTAEAERNPLVREILAAGRVHYDGLEDDDRHAFLAGPATFFRTHEVLRRTQGTNCPIRIGDREYSRDEVVEMFARCVPNARLGHIPWCSLARYRMSLGLAWSATLLVAHLVARNGGSDEAFDAFTLYYMGIATTLAALIGTALRQNRDVSQAAPWNSAMYLDLNIDLLRRDSPALAVARKEFVPQEKPFKTPQFYIALARRIESHGFDDELTERLRATEAATDGRTAMG